MTATRSPTLNAVTHLPIAETVPDGSAPGTSGNTAPREYVPFRTDKSKLRLIDTVATFRAISSNAGSGSGTFSSKSCSEPPNERSTTAFIRDPRSLTHKPQITNATNYSHRQAIWRAPDFVQSYHLAKAKTEAA